MGGLSDKEIAREMGVALDTVRTYWQRIRGKIGGQTRAEIVARMVRDGARDRLAASESQNEKLISEVARRREAELRFKAMADGAPLGIFTTSEGGLCTYANPEYLRITGMTAESVLGDGWADSVHPEDRERVFADWRASAAAGQRYQSEPRFLRPDGEVVWTFVTASQILLEGELLGYVGIVKDITERRLVHDSLRQRERMAKEIAEASLDAFFVLEPFAPKGEVVDFRFAYIGRSAEALLGRTREELNEAGLLTKAFPIPGIHDYVRAYRQVYETGESCEFESVGSGMGQGRLMHIRATRVADGVGVTVRDITEFRRLQLEAEARAKDLEALNAQLQESSERVAREHALLDAILSTAGCLVCVIDPEGRFVRFNRECERLTGWTEAEVKGKSVFEVVLPADLRNRLREITAGMRAEDFPIAFEHDWQTEAGGRRIEWRNTVLPNSQGEIAYVVATGVDVTERHAAEAELRMAKEALEVAQRIAGLGSWEYDVVAGRARWSAGMFELFDFERTEGAPSLERWLERAHPDDVDAIQEGMGHAVQAWQDATFTHRIVLRNGQIRHVTWSCKANEAQGLLYGTVLDVTERVQRESQIEEAMMRTVQESVLLEVQKEALLEANRRLDRLAVTDGLTEVLNHRAFQERLDEELQRARRHGSAVTLVLLDVDHFKRFNDDHGHQEGDRILKAVAASLKEHARATDVVARYGGEEFAVILPNTDAESGTVAAERLRAAIDIPDWRGFSVTASFGVATWGQDDTQEALIERTDRALYEAKRTGRNRVVHSDTMD